MMMYRPKRLHPITMILHLGKDIKEFLIPLAILLFSAYKANHLLSIIPAIAAFLLLFIKTILSWLRHTYQLDNKELRIEHGIFIRKKRFIPYERIQSIDMTEGILQRIFGLVKVQIETAGKNTGEGAEAVLSAISKEEARCIQEFFLEAKKSGSVVLEKETREARLVYKITQSQLLLLSLTSGGVGVVISGALAVISQFDNLIPYKKLFGNGEKLITESILLTAIMVFIGFVILWVIAFIGMMLKYAGFTVNKTKDDLIITQGLLAKRQLTIPINRIQAVRISENWLRQILGVATVYIESAGGSIKDKEDARVMLLPIMKREQIPAALKPLLTGYHFPSSFHPVPKRAARRYILRSWYAVLPIVIAGLIFFKAWGLLSFILPAVVALLAYWKYKDAGWYLEDLQLNLRFRAINRTTIFMKKNRIQSLNVSESYFQSKKELATVEAFVKSGLGISFGRIMDLSKEDINKIYDWYIA